MIAQLVEVEFVADAGAKRSDDRLELVVAVDLVGTGLFDVQHLAPEGEDGLEAGISTLCGRAACGIALDDVKLGERGIGVVAVAQFIRHLSGFEAGLAADGLAGFSGGLACAVGHHGLVENEFADGGVFLKEFRQLLRDDVADKRAHGGVAELGLCLALELRLGQLDGNDGGQTFAHIVAGDLVVALDIALFDAVGVEHVCQRPLKALLVHAAFWGMDIVCKRDDVGVERVVILQRDLRRVVSLGAGHIDDLLVDRRFVAVVPADEFADTALVAHGVHAFLFRLVRRFDALVADGDVQTGVQERLLAHTGMERFVVIFQRVEHLGVGLEGDLRAVLVRGADDAHFLGNMAAGEFHLINFPVLADLDLQPLGKGVDDRRAHAVQTAGDLIAPAAEFASCVQDGIDDLKCGLAGLGLNVDGDAAAIVGDGDGVALVDGHNDVLAVSGQRLVDRVVDDLIDQMVQT